MDAQNNLNKKVEIKYKKEKIVLAIFSLLVVLFYGNTLVNGFIHDDKGQVEDNIYIQSIKYAPKIITGCIWESAIGSCQKSSYYRPLQSFSYLLTYQISKYPWIFHLVNIFYYITCVFLVFLLVKLITKNFVLSFFAAFIFLIHPLNTETVNWIATVPELLYLIFSILSVMFYFSYREKQDRKYLKFVYLFFGLAIFSKEPAVFTPFLFLALDLTYFKKKISDFFRWENMAPYIICIAIFLIYMALRFSVLGGLGADPTEIKTIPQFIHTFISLFALYIQKVFWPHPLILYYTFHPLYQFNNWQFVVSALTTLLFFFLMYISYKKKWNLVFFSLVFFFIFLFPSLFFIGGLGENLFAERHVFASTVGFSIILAILFDYLWKKRKAFVVIFLAIATIVSFYVVYDRNKIWIDDRTIYLDTLKYSPDAEPIIYNLALNYSGKGESDLAKKEYEKIIERGTWRELYKAYNNIGNIYRAEKNYDKAIDYFEKSIKQNASNRDAYNNLGVAYIEQNKALKAITYFCKATFIDPSFKTARNNYNNLAEEIQKANSLNQTVFYDDISRNEIFKLTDGIYQFKEKDCSDKDKCILFFTGSAGKNRFLFPFLMLGKTKKNEIVKPMYVAADQKTNDIVIEINPKFKNSDITFLFPSCEDTYYKIDVSSKN